jgi:predicted SnoaL-like aldol condensation-catalyzing enzyme
MKSLKNYLSLSVTLIGIVYSSHVRSQDLEGNKEVVRTLFLEVLGNKKIDLYKSIHAADFVGHGLKKDYTLEEDFQASKQIAASYTEGKISITHLVAEGNLVSARWVVDAIMSGKKMVFDGFTIFKIENEKIKEEWSLVNQLEMFRQSEAK